MSHRYHVLLGREDGQWAIQFGDYNRGIVQDELEDMAEHQMRRRDMKIITTSDDQALIDAAVAALNR